MDVSIYRLRTRDVLTLCVLSLLILGVLMVQSASIFEKKQVVGDSAQKIKWAFTDEGAKQFRFALIAMVAFFVVGRVDYATILRGTRTLWRNPVVWMFGIAALMCFAVLVPHVGIEKNGARRWLSLGICQVQPSELAKWAVVLFLSWWLTARPVDLNLFSRFLLTLVPVGFICLLVVIQDFGTAALIGLCAVMMLIVGRVKVWHLLLVIPPALAAAGWFVLHESYRRARMLAFLDPYAHMGRGEGGYHILQSLLCFATGGITGKGLGNGIQKLGYLPEDTTDFIFSIICEELGFFGALLTAVLYLGIVYVAWQTMRKNRDSFGRMLAFGISAMVGMQAAINMAVATVSVPTKGLSLPLVSAGGSGLVITCAALGLLYSVNRFEHEDELLAPSPAKPRPQHKRNLPKTVTENIWRQWTV